MTTEEYYARMKAELNEIQWRHFLASEALRIGYGGLNQVVQESGASWLTIKKGVKEIEDGQVYHPGERIRKEGGGRKKLRSHIPGVEEAVEKLADPKGNPESPLRWTSLSMEHLAEAAKKQGVQVSRMSVYRILKEKGFALKANKKEIEGGGNHPDRNAQFEHISEVAVHFQRRGALMLSVDAKKTEIIGNYKNKGAEWQGKGQETRVNLHDFGEKDATGKKVIGIPYGVYNILQKQGFVNVGIDHNTAEFAVESIRRYYEEFGRKLSARKEILLLADGGSSNGAKNRLWKVSVQRLANETGLAISVCHYPPGTSKWNAIEHQLFSFISINWRAKPLTSYAVMLELLNHTTTQAGLTVTAMKDIHSYQTGIKIRNQQMAELNIIRDDFHGDWNYTIKPQARRSTVIASKVKHE